MSEVKCDERKKGTDCAIEEVIESFKWQQSAVYI
jgi:hypothetical protein